MSSPAAPKETSWRSARVAELHCAAVDGDGEGVMLGRGCWGDVVATDAGVDWCEVEPQQGPERAGSRAVFELEHAAKTIAAPATEQETRRDRVTVEMQRCVNAATEREEIVIVGAR